MNAPHPPAPLRLGWIVLAALAAIAACGPSEQPAKDPVLIADPPASLAGGSADDGEVQTELDRGVAYVKNEKYAEAKEHFQKAIALKPTAAAYTYLGVADEKTSDRAGAEAAYKAALGIDPGFAEAAQNLAALYLDDPARPDAAIAVLKPALAKSPDAHLLQNLGYAYGLKGDVDSASKAYEAALAKGEDAQIRFAYGSLLLDKKQPDRAAVQLKRALDGAKDDVALLVTVGRMLGSAKAFGDCVRAFDRAIQIKATDPEWFVRRGICKHELSDEKGAEADFEASIKVDANFAPAHYYLGVSYASRDNRLKATQELMKAQKLAAGSPLGKAAADKIKALMKKK